MRGGGMSGAPAPLPALVYQGSVNTWECDEGGHLNVRFHLERAMLGLGRLAAAMEMPRAFAADSVATLAPMELHARFLKEARPGASLVMHGGVVEMREQDAIVCLDMRHEDGMPATAFTLRAAHVDARGRKPFPWSKRTRAAADLLKCTPGAHAQPRSSDISLKPAQASVARAMELGAAHIGASMVTPDQCDAFGRLRAEHIFGRVSDSVSNLLSRWRHEMNADTGSGDAVPAGAVVEARMVFRRWPRAGDLIDVYSGLTEVGGKTIRLVHWLLDPATGRAWASVEAISLTFDARTRKAMAPSPEARSAALARVIKGFTV
jgi:acyl-CoA thioester hydrolase